MNLPRIILSGTSSRAGKTLVSIGLMRALRSRGYKVQPFKIGPDFIDPSYHKFATGMPSRNLDSYMMKNRDIVEVFQRNGKNADMAVIEGVMGLYDSHDAMDEKGSTAEVAKILKAPVIIIANVERISRTAAAFVLGYKLFDKAVDIKGVILNRVGSEKHAQKARLAVEKLARMEVVGVMPRSESARIPERHLGLVPAHEMKAVEKLFNFLAEFIETYVDVDRILEIANAASELPEVKENALYRPKNKYNVRLGIMRDKAFTFYYEDTLDAFAASGAKLIYINSLKDKKLPDIDALYIGGGFPEIFADALERNKKLRECIFSFCESGKPVYAECGGLMYLGEKLLNKKNEEYEMVGFLPITTRMQGKFQALGYVRSVAARDNPLSKKNDILVGHEFHHSKVELNGKVKYAYKTMRGRGIDGKRDGILLKNTLASYMHLHVLSYPKMVKNFLDAAECPKNA
ncbi:MAG: hydrogenobyrinic acid a,c-diamide synthase (glutamine-hydrolyzing) [Euryarchaeota archaeon]|nr:hydrogenobyrinic acid a,c-diamide synthase (glutamine-hydrolyzing) [Euryarchaeota archaeon]